MSKAVKQASPDDENLRPLLRSLRGLIQQARQQVLRAVDVVQVQTCWEIGRHIVEFEQNGTARAEYGTRLLPALAAALTTDFGKGFDATNLWHMRRFFLAFPILDAVRRELSWTHYRTLLRVETDQALQWYMNEAADQNWTTRVRASYAAIERWCDQFATNLLMPESMIRASFAHNDPVVVLESVTSAATRFKVSEQAF
jgi:DUF1016 N-terminal domain